MTPKLPFRAYDRSSPPPGASFYNELLADLQRNSGGYSGGFGEEGPAGQIVAPPMPWEDQGNIQPFMARLTSKFTSGGETLYHFKRVVEHAFSTLVGDAYADDPTGVTDDTANSVYYAYEVNGAFDVPTEADGTNLGAVVELRPSGFRRAFWFVWQTVSGSVGNTLNNMTLTGTTTFPTGSTLNITNTTTNNTSVTTNFGGGVVNYSTTNFNSTGGTFTLTVPIVNIGGGTFVYTNTGISYDCTSTQTMCHFTSPSALTSIIEPMPVKLTTGLTTAPARANTYPLYYNPIDETIAGAGTDGTYSIIAGGTTAGLTGSGTINRHARWSTTTALTNANLQDYTDGTTGSLTLFLHSVALPAIDKVITAGSRTNDLSTGGGADQPAVRLGLSADGVGTITGLAQRYATTVLGEMVALINYDSPGLGEFLLKQQNAGSSANNRFSLPALKDLRLLPNEAAILYQSPTDGSWFVL